METQDLCPDEMMQALLGLVETDETAGSARLLELLAAYPSDPRLHFLDGSLKASAKDHGAGAAAMRRALDLAPDYILARFQLGFLQLTSGEAIAAQETWGPLHGLPEDNYFRVFVEGLCHMIRDEFPEAIAKLERGLALNDELPPLSRDMALMRDEIRTLKVHDAPNGNGDEEPMSAAQMLLRQASFKATRH